MNLLNIMIFFFQEIWLFTYELSILSTINSEFESFGINAIDDINGIVHGRPYGGMGILIRKSYRRHAEFHNFNDLRIVGITLCTWAPNSAKFRMGCRSNQD